MRGALGQAVAEDRQIVTNPRILRGASLRPRQHLAERLIVTRRRQQAGRRSMLQVEAEDGRKTNQSFRHAAAPVELTLDIVALHVPVLRPGVKLAQVAPLCRLAGSKLPAGQSREDPAHLFPAEDTLA